jgi:hypothetical protein
MTLNNNSIGIEIQSWFIPIDIFMIICPIFAIMLALIFIFIIITDKTCHTVPMILVANSCLVELVLGSDLLGMTVHL